MDFVAKPIDVIVLFTYYDRPMPVKFRYVDEEGNKQIVKIEKVLYVTENEIPGVKTLLYQCQSKKGINLYTYQLMFKPDTNRWLLYRI